MSIHITRHKEAPDREEFTPMLEEFYAQIIARLQKIGGPEAKTEGLVVEFWETIDQYLPPKGCLLSARNAAGALVGMGGLRPLGDGKGEMKRVFVRPAGRGTGLGRTLIEKRIEAARDLGMNSLFADTFKFSVEMISLYEQMGFKQIDIYPQSASYNSHPELAKYMIFLKKDL